MKQFILGIAYPLPARLVGICKAVFSHRWIQVWKTISFYVSRP